MNRLYRYQWGGLNNASLNYSTPYLTGWKPNTATSTLFPELSDPKRYSNASVMPNRSTSATTEAEEEEEEGGGGFDYMEAIGTGISTIMSGIQTGITYSNMANQAKERERREQEALKMQGDRRYMGLTGQMRGNTYGMFNRYQTGGVANPYGTMTDPDMLERTGQRKITEQATEDITIATLKTVAPPVGAAIEQGISLFTGIQDAAGKQDAELDGKAIDVYPDETAAAVGNAADMFMPHKAAFRQAQNEDYGRAVLSWTGLGAIPNMIEAMQDQEEYEMAQERLRTSSGRMVGGTSGLGGTEIVGGTNMTALREQQEIPMGKYGGLMEKYGSGGYRVEKSSDRKGKTHKVTGPDGSVKYFGDPNLGERSDSKYGKEAFYSRHKDNLDANPHFRAYARATWETGGMYPDTPEMGMGGYIDTYKRGGLYANIHAKRERIQAGSGESMRSPGSEGAPTDRAFTDSAKTAKKGMGGYMEYADGGIHIDPSKRGTFKAQATRMDMGVQEAADKILSAPEGTYSPEMRKKANFARNFAKKYGGMMEYQTGGMSYSDGVKRSNANAELEGDEVVMKNGGKRAVKVKGPSHEKGGVPMNLQPGDYVWSDHLKDPQTGKSMAELYEEMAESGASDRQIQMLMMYQEQLAGRAPGQGMEQTAKSGGLMKYQNGTLGPIPGITPRFNMFGKYPNNPEFGTGMKGVSVPKEYLETVTADKESTRVKTTQKKAAAVSKPKTVEVPPSPPPYDVLGDYATITGPGLGYIRPSQPRPNIQGLTTVDFHPLDGYPGSPGSPKQAAVPKSEKKLSNLVKYAPELGLLAMGAIEAAMVPSEYDLPEVPATPQISVDKVFLDRSRAGELARARGAAEFRTSIDAARGSGMGPGAMSYMQREQNAIRNAVEEAAINAEKLNLAQSAEEKKLNLGAEVDTKKFNAEMKRVYDALGIARGTSLADFKIQRRNAIAEALKSGVVGAANTYSSQRLGDAYAGNTGVMDRFTIKQLEDLLAKKKEQESNG